MSSQINPPYGVLAELTHRCPLACLYCSNPVALKGAETELTTDQWKTVLRTARELGAIQLHLSGGEPLLRSDLEELAAHASALGFYINLITSGIGLSAERSNAIARSGINNVQLSLQSHLDDTALAVCGRRSVEAKLNAARHLQQAGVPLSWNIVLHKLNIAQITEMVTLCAEFQPHKIELAHVQFHGLALANREHLKIEPSMVQEAETQVNSLRRIYGDSLSLVYIKPDWHESFPKPCNGGWANLQLTVAPDGTVLPCAGAYGITTMKFENIRNQPLRWIWFESPAFNAFRGTNWMGEPCRSCDKREIDFGGCRCQAFALTGEAARTDPACTLSSDRGLIDNLLATALITGSNGKNGNRD
ncbi:MAG: pyrroloquinoline quinone biosynthesis protein PqqE [Candidatus Obscuribacterales bacterium]|nr:pyrroloquinoline quinone biosynthesis protein PqqE [Candidatus Obscuribacterales bacterium]